MASAFVWLDHRQEDAERIREALAALEDPGMVDPLGFGIIRDAFSEMLFPGTSTIQTRARYFLFVPWVFQRLNEDGIGPQAAAALTRQMELDLIQSLLRGSGDQEGIIGRRSWPNTKQLPSLIYWGGLATWRIRRFIGTRYEYFQTLDRRGVADDSEIVSPWHPRLPSTPKDLFEATRLDLAVDEAEFLRDQILAAAGDSFLAVLVRDGSLDETADSPWEHPQAHAAQGKISDQIRHAKLFAVATWGAGLLYNDHLSMLLQRDGLQGLGVDFRASIDEWFDLMDRHEREFASWDREEFWYLVRRESGVPTGLVSFVDWWLDRVVADPRAVLGDEDVRRRLAVREASIKGARSKLANRGARERSASAQGYRMQLFRWPKVDRIVADIQEGLGR